MSAFDYAESENTVAIAQIAATMTGGIPERFSRIAALMDAAKATSSKVMDGDTVIAIVRVASAINKPKSSPEALVGEAIELLQNAGDFRSKRWANNQAKNRISNASIFLFQLPVVGEAPIKIPAEIVNTVADYDFTFVTTFDKWLQMMMPTRKKIDRLPRYRLYLSGGSDNLDDVDKMLQEVKRRFRNGFPNLNLGWNGRAATADFMAWDLRQKKKSFSERGEKGAAMRHKKRLTPENRPKGD